MLMGKLATQMTDAAGIGGGRRAVRQSESEAKGRSECLLTFSPLRKVGPLTLFTASLAQRAAGASNTLVGGGEAPCHPPGAVEAQRKVTEAAGAPILKRAGAIRCHSHPSLFCDFETCFDG